MLRIYFTYPYRAVTCFKLISSELLFFNFLSCPCMGLQYSSFNVILTHLDYKYLPLNSIIHCTMSKGNILILSKPYLEWKLLLWQLINHSTTLGFFCFWATYHPLISFLCIILLQQTTALIHKWPAWYSNFNDIAFGYLR